MNISMTCLEHIAMTSWKREFDLEITNIHGGPPASDENWTNVPEDIKQRHREYARAAVEVWKHPERAHLWYGELAHAVLDEIEARSVKAVPSP